jgi:glycosyltransferase involved in cell wall biosynthesis
LRSLGRKRVLLLDPPREQVVAAYKDADLLVFASNIEYSPLVLYEAAAAGLPFIASPAGNSAEIAQWTGGGLVLPAAQRPDGWVQVSVPDLTRAIEDLLADPTRRAALGQAGQAAWQARFTWEDIVVRYEQLYLQAIQRRSSLS